jgi:hypothetical protein
MSNVRDSDVTFKNAGVCISRSEDAVVTLSVHGEYLLALVCAAAMLVTAVAAVLFSPVVLALLAAGPGSVPAEIASFVVLLLLFGGIIVGCCGGAVLLGFSFLQASFPRQFTFAVGAGRCWFRNVPGCGRCFPFSDLQSVALLTGKARGWNVAWLCLSVKGMKRHLRIKAIGRTRGPEERVAAELQPLAVSLSDMLGLPLRHHKNASLKQVSWL